MPSAPKGKKARKSLSKPVSVSYSSTPHHYNPLIDTLREFRGIGTVVVAFILIVIYFLMMIMSNDIFIIDPTVLNQWSQINYLILQGEYWRLITPIFVHANIIHLGGNLLFLFIFGWRLEELKGTKQFFIVFILTGIGGNLFTFSLILAGGSGTLYFSSVGASGAIQGLFGANITYMYMDNKYPKGGLTFLSFIVIFFMMTIGANTNVVAHFGGLLTGIIYVYLTENYKKH